MTEGLFISTLAAFILVASLPSMLLGRKGVPGSAVRWDWAFVLMGCAILILAVVIILIGPGQRTARLTNRLPGPHRDRAGDGGGQLGDVDASI